MKLQNYTITGYGNIVPTTNASKLFCIFYTLVGVPLLFLSLTNIGQFIAEGYWIFLASLHRTHVLLIHFLIIQRVRLSKSFENFLPNTVKIPSSKLCNLPFFSKNFKSKTKIKASVMLYSKE